MKTQFTTDREKLESTMERVFDVSREEIWKAHTTAEIIEKWWGPRKYTIKVEEFEPKPGGKWKMVHTKDDEKHVFFGEFKDIKEPEYKSGIEARESIRENVRSIRERYGLKIDMKKHSKEDESREVTVLRKLSLFEAEFTLRDLRGELAKYPVEFFRNIGIKKIRIATRLKTQEGMANGVSSEDGVIYVTPERPVHTGYIVHHELYHSIDHTRYSMAEKSLAAVLSVVKHEMYWALLRSRFVSSPSSYARDLGVDHVWQDRATVAEALMTSPKAMMDRARGNYAFRKKLLNVAANYSRASNGLMDKKYFNDLASGIVKEGYWEK